MLEKFFKLREHQTTLQREIYGGVTTFMTMAYIIFVQPVVMAAAGMDLEAVLVATCLASALATFAMGLLANYPIALATAMGHNFFFTLLKGVQGKIRQVPWLIILFAVLFVLRYVFLGV